MASTCKDAAVAALALRRTKALIAANVTCLGTAIPAVATTAELVLCCPSKATADYALDLQTSQALCSIQTDLTVVEAQLASLDPIAQFRTEVHFAIRTDGVTGTGTFDNPYNYVSQAAFDALVNALPAQTAIQLEAGTFITNGLVMKNLQILRGRGRGTTVLKLADGVVTSGVSATVIFAGYNLTRFEVEDLTIDCNLANQPAVVGGLAGAVGAVALVTEQGRIERVDVIGCYANPGEGFPVSINGQTVTTATTPCCAIIRDVKVLDPVGYQTCISIFNQTGGAAYVNEHTVGVIENCQVCSTAGSASIGFGAGGWDKMIVRNNYVNNLATFMVHDTHVGRDVEISSNRAVDITSWFLLANGANASQYDNYRILNNISKVKAGSEAVCQHLALSFIESLTSLQIRGNVFDSGSVTLPGTFYAFNVQAPKGIIEDNWVSPNLLFQSGSYPSSGIITKNNRYFSGHPMEDYTTPNSEYETWEVRANTIVAGDLTVNLGEFRLFHGAQLMINAALTEGATVGDSQTISVSIRQNGEVNARILSRSRQIADGFNYFTLESLLNVATGYYALFLKCVVSAADGVVANVTGTPLVPSTLPYNAAGATIYNPSEILAIPYRRPILSTPGAGAGVGAVVNVVGDSCSGYIAVLAAGVPTVGGIITSIAFGTLGTEQFPAGTVLVVTLTPAGTLASGDYGVPWVSNADPNGFDVNAKTAPLVAGTTYQWFYQVTTANSL